MSDVITMLENVKKFFTEEKWSYFSLVMYLLFWIGFVNWYLPFINDNIENDINPLRVILFTTIFVLIFWLFTRKIDIKTDKVNIWVAKMDVLNVSAKETISWEKKLQISSEINNYIYNQLAHVQQWLKLEANVNFLLIPPRISVNYSSCNSVPQKLWIDSIIWWAIRYDNGKIFINTKFAFSKEVSSIFFQKLIDDLNAYPEIQFDFSEKDNLEFDKFIHEVIYISILYRSLDLINKYKYEEADKLLNYAHEKLNKLYDNKEDQSVNRWDREISKIEFLMYAALAKNYINRSNSLLANFDYKNQANDMLEKCAEVMKKQLVIIKKYLKESESWDYSDRLAVENTYLNAISKLWKTKQKKVIDDELKKVDPKIKEQYQHETINALIAARFKNFDDAKTAYEKVLKKDFDNVVVLRGLWLIEYSTGNYPKAKEYLDKLCSISEHYIFDKHIYDTKVQKFLVKINLKTGKFLSAMKHYIKYKKYKSLNRKTQSEMYVLKAFGL